MKKSVIGQSSTERISCIYSRSFNNNLIFTNGKPYCCNDTFSDIRITSLLAKTIFLNTNYFYAVRISILLAILCEILI